MVGCHLICTVGHTQEYNCGWVFKRNMFWFHILYQFNYLKPQRKCAYGKHEFLCRVRLNQEVTYMTTTAAHTHSCISSYLLYTLLGLLLQRLFVRVKLCCSVQLSNRRNWCMNTREIRIRFNRQREVTGDACVRWKLSCFWLLITRIYSAEAKKNTLSKYFFS